MKAKKARRRLRRVENLLATVIKKYSTTQRNVHDLLDTAKTAVAGALTSLPRTAKKPLASASKARAEQPVGPKRVAANAGKRAGASRPAAGGQSLSKAG